MRASSETVTRLVDIAVHERPDTVGNHARHTVDGTLHLGVGEVVAGVCLRSPGLSQGRLGLELFVTCHLHVEIRHDPFTEKRLLALPRQPRGLQPGLGARYIGLGRFERRPVGNLVNDEKHLSLAYDGAFVNKYVGNDTADLRPDFHALATPQRGGIVRMERHASEFGRQGCVFPGNRLRPVARTSAEHRYQEQEKKDAILHFWVFVSVICTSYRPNGSCLRCGSLPSGQI